MIPSLLYWCFLSAKETALTGKILFNLLILYFLSGNY